MSSGPGTSQQPDCKGFTGIEDLPDEVFHVLLRRVSRQTKGFSHALVCRRWYASACIAQRVVCFRPRQWVFQNPLPYWKVDSEATRFPRTEEKLISELQQFPNLKCIEIRALAASSLSDAVLDFISSRYPGLSSLRIGKPPFASAAKAWRIGKAFSDAAKTNLLHQCTDLRRVVFGGYFSPEDIGLLPASLTSLDWVGNRTVLQRSPGHGTLEFKDPHGVDGEHPPWPEGAQKLRRLREMVLIPSGDHLVILKQLWVPELRSLTSLELRDISCVGEVPEQLSVLTALRRLELCSIFVPDIPASMSQLTGLTHLGLFFEHGPQLPRFLSGFRGLRRLEVECSEVESLPWSAADLSQVESLTLEVPASAVSSLPLDQLQRVKRLSIGCLHGGPLWPAPEELYPSILDMKALSSLTVNWAYSLETLHQDISRLSALQELSLSNLGNIEELPASLGGLRSLTSFRLVQLECLTEVPESVGALGQLVELSVDSCDELVAVSETLGQLSNLQRLRLQRCRLLSFVPQSLGCLRNLVSLQLSHMPVLEEIPDTICSVSSLEHVQIHKCPKVRMLPEYLGALRRLRSLELTALALETLPPSLGKLRRLTSLELALPSDTRLPPGLLTLPSLTWLRLDGFPLELELPANCALVHGTGCSICQDKSLRMH